MEYLIDDLASYSNNRPYYMQPLVVAAQNPKDKNGPYIIVDGQQRLTTFFLIWRKMNPKEIVDDKPTYKLTYEQRPESASYLDTTNQVDNNTPDICNFKAAEEVIEAKKDIINSEKFKSNFFEKATFLWYELDDPKEGPKMFERLNGKRIALTDIELCKVLLLSNACTSSTQRSERASAWQNMEYRLQDDKFYAFISKDFNGSQDHDISRMDLVLEVALDKTEDNAEYSDYPLYSHLKKIDGKDIWHKITQTFHRIELLYDNLFYYNLVGFLTINGTPIKDIMKEIVQPNFGELLVKRVNDWVESIDIRNLVYKDAKTYPALILFNVLCDLMVNQSNKKPEERFWFTNRFRYDLLRAEGFDKEHVHATHSKNLQSAIEWQQWIIHILKYWPKKQLLELPPNILQKMKDVIEVRIDSQNDREALTKAIEKILSRDTFNEIFDTISKSVQENNNEDEDKQNSIGNMALLNTSINRDPAYAASPFAVKRAIIHERIKSGKFVPNGTRLMFDKSFRKSPDEMYHWAKNPYSNGDISDKDEFINFFENTLQKLK